MRWTLAACVAAVLAGSAIAAPEALARHGCEPAGFVRADSRRLAWRPAHVEERIEWTVLREGRWVEESIPATFGLRFDFGSRRLVRVVVTPAAVRRTWIPAEFGRRVVRVLVPGRWVPVHA